MATNTTLCAKAISQSAHCMGDSLVQMIDIIMQEKSLTNEYKHARLIEAVGNMVSVVDKSVELTLTQM